MTITTTFNRLGDFVVVLPVASWVYKTTGEKTHFVFTKQVPTHIKMEPILRAQEFTSNVSYVDLPVIHAGDAGTLSPDILKQFGINEGRNLNLGFFTWPQPHQFIGRFYANQYGLGFDEDYVMKCPVENCPVYDDVWIETEPYRTTYKSLPKIIPPNAVELKLSDPMEYNLGVALKAKNVWTNGGGFAVLLDMAGKDNIILYKPQEEIRYDPNCLRRKHRYLLYQP